MDQAQGPENVEIHLWCDEHTSRALSLLLTHSIAFVRQKSRTEKELPPQAWEPGSLGLGQLACVLAVWPRSFFSLTVPQFPQLKMRVIIV